MSATVMNPVPHRKPVPGRPAYGNLHPQQNALPPPPPPPPPQQYRGEQRGYSQLSASNPPPPNGSAYPSNRASSIYSVATTAPSIQQQQYYAQPARRTLSNATSSTSSSKTSTGLTRNPTNSSMPRRSTSSRSNTSVSPTSYVALMRKQKATVWCDRAQQEDPRLLAAQRAAKLRATLEVAGSAYHSGRMSSGSGGQAPSGGGIRSKIRHHGAPKASTYTSGNMSGAGVPMRLSATEVDENDSDEEDSKYMKYHQRTGSGRSSLNSGTHPPSAKYLHSGRGHSNGSTPPNGHSPVESMGDLVEEETPVPTDSNMQASGYFDAMGGSGGSGSSTEAEQRFGGIGGLPPGLKAEQEQQRKTSEELRRRGSVDDRAMTMGGGRLFVANPDLYDD